MSFFDDPHAHPDSITIEIGGKEVPWLLNKSAIETAKEEDGIDLQELEQIDEENLEEALDGLAALFYIGTIPFRENGDDVPTLEDFDDVITPRTAHRVAPRLMAHYQGLTDEEIEETVGKETEGAQSSTSTS